MRGSLRPLVSTQEVIANDNIFSCARLHRMISDLTVVLATQRRKPVVLVGDLNTTTQGATSGHDQAANVFDRLKAWGLIDCAFRTRGSRPVLQGCTCHEGDGCSHVRTYRHGHRADSEPTQLDYVFASGSLATALSECRVVDDPDAWDLSDHCPIVLDLRFGSQNKLRPSEL
jgi:endonuclease/exonuclease/phosphatase family metal-dependent hydrolase